jgi:PTH1 family peptidyl-tRNA hydrolase
MSISLVAGLGNPGRAYADTRHNIGWQVLEAFAARRGLVWKAQAQFEAETARWDRAPGQTCHLVKPLTFMNESGRALQALASYYKVPSRDVIVVYDDLNLDLGRVKISVRGSAGGHNGIVSTLAHLGDDFVRYRIGIGPKLPAEMDLKDFVLGKFTPEQSRLLDTTLDTLVSGLALLIEHGADRAMNLLNRRAKNEPEQT